MTNNFHWDDGSIAAYQGHDPHVVIPPEATCVGWNAFENCTFLESVEIHGGITEVGGCAFAGCTSLRSVKIEEGVPFLAWNAFRGCITLEEIELPQSISCIAGDVFEDCTALRRITVPPYIKDLPSSVFENCTALTEVELGYGMKKLEWRACFGCTALRTIKIPATVREIEDDVFAGCQDLTICAPKGSFAEAYAKENGFAFREWADPPIPPVRFDICNGVLRGYRGAAEQVVIPDGVTELSDKVFFEHDEIKAVELPATLKKIGVQAFGGCTSLETVTGGDALIDIEEAAFADCKALRGFVIPNGLSEIKPFVFGNTGIAKIDLPQTVKIIRANAFSHCEELRSVVVPDTVEVLEHGVFFHCVNLRTVQLPRSLTTIPAHLFASCEALAKIDFPNEVKEIERCAFMACKSLKQITIPPSVKTIREEAFSYCEGLQTLCAEEGLRIIEGRAFSYCRSLCEARLPASLCEIGRFAFLRADRALQIIAPDGSYAAEQAKTMKF